MFQIELATTENIPILVTFQKAMALESENLQLNEDTLHKGIQAVFTDNSKGTYYIAKKANTIVGCLLLQNEWSDWRNGSVKWIHSVYVLPEFRKQGVFKSLYDHVKNLVLKNESFKGLRLYVDQTNQKAQKTYEKIGMTHHHYFLYEWMKSC